MGPDERFRIRVVDIRDLSKEVTELAGKMGALERVTFRQRDIRDLEWEAETEKAYFLCTDDDLGNLTLAMSLAKRAAWMHIYVRMTHWPLSAVTEHLGEEKGIVFINVNELMEQGLPDMAGLYRAARETDLKRMRVSTNA
jgi:hypothetical protein